MKFKFVFAALFLATLFMACEKDAASSVETLPEVTVATKAGNKVFLKRRPHDCLPTNVQTYCVVIQPSTRAIQSIGDFYDRVGSGIHPLNQLSSQAVNHFSQNLLFNGNQWKGGDYEMIDNELSERDLEKFWLVLLGDI